MFLFHEFRCLRLCSSDSTHWVHLHWKAQVTQLVSFIPTGSSFYLLEKIRFVHYKQKSHLKLDLNIEASDETIMRQ